MTRQIADASHILSDGRTTGKTSPVGAVGFSWQGSWGDERVTLTVPDWGRALRGKPARSWRYLDELTVRMPLPDEVKTLRLLPGTPLTSVLRTYYDQSGNPFEVARYTLPGDRTTLVYEGRLSKPRRRIP